MIIKIWKFLLYCIWLSSLTTNAGTASILIEKEVSWSHPVLDVFKKHAISLSKIRYFSDGTCPVFFVDFKTSPKTQDFNKAYGEILKANSNFPYALVDKKNNLMINVGWNDDIPSTMDADVGAIVTIPQCNEGSRTMSFKFKMNPNLKKNILRSPYKALMKRRDGKELVAYLYAENGISKPAEYYTNDGQEKTTTSTSGNFYIYLYDPATDKFFPNKIAPFYSIKGFSMYQGRSDFTVLRHKKKSQSDVLLIGVFVNANGDQYEAYGFSEELSTLKKYRFTIKEKRTSAFYGRLSLYNNTVYAYNKHEHIDENEKSRGRIEQFKFHVSDMPGEIRVEPLIRKMHQKKSVTNVY